MRTDDAVYFCAPARLIIEQGGRARLPELVAHSIEDYETQAVRLACEPHRLDALRASLDRHRLASSLFDTGRYTRQLEEAFRRVVARHRAGLPPADLEVGPVPTRNGSGA